MPVSESNSNERNSNFADGEGDGIEKDAADWSSIIIIQHTGVSRDDIIFIIIVYLPLAKCTTVGFIIYRPATTMKLYVRLLYHRKK